MNGILRKIFVENWLRKLISTLLAVAIWFTVNQSLTSTRNISNIPIRIVHLPKGKTVEGMQPGGRLARKLTLTLVGNRSVIEELTPSDLEVVLDASEKPEEWLVTLSKKNLVSLNPEVDIDASITRAYHPNFSIRMARLVTDQIPLVITKPIGEPPRGYQLLNVWPYHLNLTVSGPEEVVKRLKSHEQRITYNLSDISKTQLDEVAFTALTSDEVVSFFVPDEWKQVQIPALSDSPLEINDPEAKALRIDFLRCHLLPIQAPIHCALFFSKEALETMDPEDVHFAKSPLLHCIKEVPFLSLPLYANGVDQRFLDLVREQLQLVWTVNPSQEKKALHWSIQFIDIKELEERYVTTLMADVPDRDVRLMKPAQLEEYLRNRFRSYMQHFELFNADESKFELTAFLNRNQIELSVANLSGPLK
jgi:hypothetical protein